MDSIVAGSGTPPLDHLIHGRELVVIDTRLDFHRAWRPKYLSVVELGIHATLRTLCQ